MAARAARRIPLVGTSIAVAPLIRAVGDSGLSTSNLTNMTAWKTFVQHVIRNYTGVDETGAVNGAVLVTTYVPVIGYIIARKTGLSKPISRALGKIGLRF